MVRLASSNELSGFPCLPPASWNSLSKMGLSVLWRLECASLCSSAEGSFAHTTTPPLSLPSSRPSISFPCLSFLPASLRLALTPAFPREFCRGGEKLITLLYTTIWFWCFVRVVNLLWKTYLNTNSISIFQVIRCTLQIILLFLLFPLGSLLVLQKN